MDKYALTNCILLDGTEQMEPVAHKMLLFWLIKAKFRLLSPQLPYPRTTPSGTWTGNMYCPG